MIKIDNWQKISLGEIADEISERIDNPSESGFERFVGLEHFVSGNLKIRQCGTTSNLVSAMKLFQKGDILFARRNAYLKRASMVEFDGVCSGDAFVVRENKDRVVPGFLAFVFNSEALWHYANSYAAGTMSKRVKWCDLAKYILRLPPIPEQKRLADLLWSVDEVIENWINTVGQLELLLRSLMRNRFESYNVDEIKIKALLRNSSDFKVGKIPQSDYQKSGKYPIIDQSKAEVAGYSDNEELLYAGDLPVLVFGDHTTETKHVDSPFILGADGTKVILPKQDVDSRYLFYAIRNLNMKPVGYRRHFSILKDSKIKMPDINAQKYIVRKLDRIFAERLSITKHVECIKSIQKQIINQIFG
jgi:type I restriction enzyme, S subunit